MPDTIEAPTLTLGQRVSIDVIGEGGPLVGTVYAVSGDATYAWVGATDWPESQYGYAYAESGVEHAGSTPSHAGYVFTPASGVPEGTRGFWVHRDNITPVTTDEAATPEPTPHDVPALLERITSLESQLADRNAAVSEAHNVLTQIGEALKETADLSDWCGEYDRRLSQLVDSLPGRFGFDDTFNEAAHREREYEVCVHWTVSYAQTATVSASSEDAAIEQVSDDPFSFVSDDYNENDRDVTEIHIDG